MALRVIWQYMDRSVTKQIIYGPKFFGDGPVHILPYDPKWHELFAILYFLSKIIMQVPGRSIYSKYFMALRVIWQYMDRSFTTKILYGPQLSIWTGPSPKKYYMDISWGPYNIFLVTDRSIYCHMTRSDMNYLLYYTFYLK